MDHHTQEGHGDSIEISCATCNHRATEACSDCLVSFLCNREPDDAVIIDVVEIRGLRLLESAGLVPGLRFADRSA